MNHYSLASAPFNKLYQETIDQALIDCEKFFGIKLSQNLCLIYLNSRQQFDDVLGRKTLPFETGSSISNLIFMMAEEVFEQESNKKFSQESTVLTLRHEVCHKFFQRLAWTSQPTWLNEGTAIYLSGQLKKRNKIDKFSNFLLFESTNFIDGQNVYKESGFFVEKIIDLFGKEKFIEFLKSIRKNSGNQDVLKTFNQIYGLELNYDNINKL